MCLKGKNLAERVGFESRILPKLLSLPRLLSISSIFKLLVRMPFFPLKDPLSTLCRCVIDTK